MVDGGGHEREPGLVQRVLARSGPRRAAFVLWMLVGLAALAPFVASDLPWYVRAVDREEVEGALRSLAPLARSCDRLARTSDAEYEATRLAGATTTRAEALALERGAVALRFAVVDAALEGGDAIARGLLVDALEARALTDGRELGPVAEAYVAQARIVEEAEGARSSASGVGSAGNGLRTAGGGRFVARARWPLLAALDGASVFLVFAWGALGVLLARGARAARGRGRAPSARVVGGALAASLGLALAWSALRPAEVRLDPRPWKARLASESVRVERAVFAPIAMGFAETNVTEAWRPPTWLASAERDEAGRYVRGARAAHSGANGANGAGGLELPPTPVDVRPGEPARNSPWRHVLGTDGSGRDVLARLLHGARASLAVGFGAALLLALLGTLVGVVAGTLRGVVDLVLSRVLEVVVCFPAFFLVLAFAAVADPDVVPPALSVALVIGGVGWTGVARLVRVRALELADAEFVLAARAQGLSSARILFAHVLPNAAAPALVALSFGVGSAILTESALSFLGLGVQIPVPSWGALAAESRSLAGWWTLVFPAACVLASSLAANVLGEGVRDALDPRAEAAR